MIDLRFNPGGLMPQAVGTVDRFVDRGVIVSTVNRREAVRQYLASAAGTNRNVKLVVLVNGESASASEIVSGSLQDHGRAIVMGERTFGKGSVQNLIRLKESAGAIKLTTAYYRLPKGRIVHRTRQNAATDEWGVIPDVKVALTREEKAAVRAARRRLDNGKGSGGALPMDRQLDAAVKTLREALSTRANLSLGHTEDRRLRLVHALP
ncbi:MAG: hypothetical protein D6788_04850 [Planctomycetota bacterium]|nr:MAG: hypothetical protein D6788_04850 [Planctomycetota bacterium]